MESWFSMTCGREGSCMVPEMWDKPLWEIVWPYLDQWDSVRQRTASTHWNVPKKYGRHGEGRLLFCKMRKTDRVVDDPVVMHLLLPTIQNKRKRSLSPSESSVKNRTACSVRNVLCELPHGRKHHQRRLFSTTFFFCNIFSLQLSTST